MTVYESILYVIDKIKKYSLVLLYVFLVFINLIVITLYTLMFLETGRNFYIAIIIIWSIGALVNCFNVYLQYNIVKIKDKINNGNNRGF